MNLKGLLNRKLAMAVLSPVARAVSSAIVGYLVAKGVPADQADQMGAALGALSVVSFNVCWELFDRRKAENRAVGRFLDDVSRDGSGR